MEEDENGKTLLRVWAGKKGDVHAEMPGGDVTVLDVAGYIANGMRGGDRRPLHVLFSIVVHLLSMEATGRLQREFIRNLESTAPKYREMHRRAAEWLRKGMGKPGS